MALPANADIPLILDRIRPGAEWGFIGDNRADVVNLSWRDRVQSEPTEIEMEAEWATIEAEIANSGAPLNQLQADKNRIEAQGDYRAIRALGLVVLDEINTLRAIHSLSARTKTQLRDAVRTKIDNRSSNNL